MTQHFTPGRLIDPLTEGQPREVAHTIERLIRAIDTAEDQIESGLYWVKTNATSIEAALAGGLRLNGLSITQHAAAIDQAMTLRQSHVDMLVSLVGEAATTDLINARAE